MMEEKVFRITQGYEEFLMNSSEICPHCGERFWIKKGVEVAVTRKLEIECEPTFPIVDLSADDRFFLSEMVSDGKVMNIMPTIREELAGTSKNDRPFESFQRSPVFTCPYCETKLQLKMLIAVIGAELFDGAVQKTPGKPPAPRKGSIEQGTPQQQQMYEEWTKNGLIDLYMEAIKAGSPTSTPQTPLATIKSIETWFRCCQFFKVPQRVISRFVLELQDTEVKFYQANGVVGIVAGGYLRSFFSKSRALGYGDEKLTMSGTSNRIEEKWVKTPFGYALGRGVFFQALQAESKASLGKATGKQRGTQSYSAKDIVPEQEAA